MAKVFAFSKGKSQQANNIKHNNSRVMLKMPVYQH